MQVTALRERLADATADALAAGGRAEGPEPEGAGARRGGADAELLAVSDGRLQVTVINTINKHAQVMLLCVSVMCLSRSCAYNEAYGCSRQVMQRSGSCAD